MNQIVEALKKGDPVEIAKAIDLGVNSFNIPYKEIIQEITGDAKLNRCFMEISIWWIKKGAADLKEKWSYDGRNEYSCKVCGKLADTLFIQQAEETAPREYTELAKKTVKAMDQMHRTLKQSFSGLVFRYLRTQAECDDSVKAAVSIMDLTLHEDWEHCPLI